LKIISEKAIILRHRESNAAPIAIKSRSQKELAKINPTEKRIGLHT